MPNLFGRVLIDPSEAVPPITIAVVIAGIDSSTLSPQPWMVFRRELRAVGIDLQLFMDSHQAFQQRFDAMMLHVWQDWKNPALFNAKQILPIMEQYAVYRATYPETVQIVLNHTDMGRRPYATPYWRSGDPVLYRTPAYDRRELYPFPPESIWPYEKVWGKPCFASEQEPAYAAGFIGTSSGPKGYRERVAEQTARVGIGLCAERKSFNQQDYHQRMQMCRMIVCPRGWGEQSLRHWDTWLSGKPMLTDRDADSVELIPGRRLRAGVHYIVFDEPEEIPDLVRHWTHPARRDQLEQIARQGREAALSYDPLGSLVRFFRNAVPRRVSI